MIDQKKLQNLRDRLPPLERARDAILGGGPIDDDNLQVVTSAINDIIEAIWGVLSDDAPDDGQPDDT